MMLHSFNGSNVIAIIIFSKLKQPYLIEIYLSLNTCNQTLFKATFQWGVLPKSPVSLLPTTDKIQQICLWFDHLQFYNLFSL